MITSTERPSTRHSSTWQPRRSSSSTKRRVDPHPAGPVALFGSWRASQSSASACSTGVARVGILLDHAHGLGLGIVGADTAGRVSVGRGITGAAGCCDRDREFLLDRSRASPVDLDSSLYVRR